MTARMLSALSNLPIKLIAIDEAHCLSRWGPSFRPDYEELIRLRGIFPGVPLAALTATADKSTQDDITTKLFGGEGQVFVSGFDRPNIQLEVVMRTDAKLQLLEVVKAHKGESGIVYCLSRAKTEKMTAFLCENGVTALAYHAGMTAEVRTRNQTTFMMETSGVVIVATIAFGMGIDKPDVRFVCHTDMPGSIEAYYQEIGRAGRDGKPAVAKMIYGLDDLRMRRLFIEQEDGDLEHKRREHKRLDALLSYCEASECRRNALLDYFNEEQNTKVGCGNCDICLNPPKVMAGTEVAQKLLSVVLETGQVFGQAHLIDILRGANTEKMRSFQHNQLPSHGVGGELDKDIWRTIIRQLVAGGYLKLDVTGYGGLSVLPKGHAILNGDRDFSYRSDVVKSRGQSKSKKISRGAMENLTPEQSKLLKHLKDKRTELARIRKVPPYMIFSDRSLEDMAKYQPKDELAFGDIHGVGAMKLKNFATYFIGVVSQYTESQF
jgi:ATP-dependent DNA helicase RecQ